MQVCPDGNWPEGSHGFALWFVPYKESTRKRVLQFVRNGERFDGARHKSYGKQGSMAVLEHLAHKNLYVPGRSVHSMHRKRANGEGEPALRPEGANMPAVWTIAVGRCRERYVCADCGRELDDPEDEEDDDNK